MATQADLDNLDRMIASGVLSSAYDGKRVEYRSMADLLVARAHLAGQLQATSGTAPSRNHAPEFRKGV